MHVVFVHCVYCSRSLSLYMRQFVCSVVVGKDLVPRLGIITLNNLKRQMLNELNSCHLPKVCLVVAYFISINIQHVTIYNFYFVHLLWCFIRVFSRVVK